MAKNASLVQPRQASVDGLTKIAQEDSVYEDGGVRRDFIIDDVADAILRMIDIEGRAVVRIDIGSGSFQTVRQPAELIASIHDPPAPLVTGQSRYGDVRRVWADPEPARGLLGFSAQVSVDRDSVGSRNGSTPRTEYL